MQFFFLQKKRAWDGRAAVQIKFKCTLLEKERSQANVLTPTIKRRKKHKHEINSIWPLKKKMKKMVIMACAARWCQKIKMAPLFSKIWHLTGRLLLLLINTSSAAEKGICRQQQRQFWEWTCIKTSLVLRDTCLLRLKDDRLLYYYYYAVKQWETRIRSKKGSV